MSTQIDVQGVRALSPLSGWRRVVRSAMLLACVAVLWGCAASGDRRDVQTASDQTDAQRRAEVRLELATAYFGRGQNTTALDEVKQALAANPEMVAGYNLRGLIYASMGELTLADESFRHALRINPSDADTLHNHGWFLCRQRRFEEADQQFAAAIATPNYRDLPRTLMTQGICQARNGQMAQAEATLSRAYELDPSSPAAAVNLSEVLHRRGEDERARFYIRRVNVQDNLVSAQSLWLALRIERRLGQTAQVGVLGEQLKNRFPQSPEALMYERGQFDE